MVHLRLSVVEGSAPREVGAEMLVTAADQAGTIGGGQVEFRAVARARVILEQGIPQDSLTLALGPDIGQCCGGRVTVELTALDPDARTAMLARLDAAQAPCVMILGAGHVGRALAQVLAPLPCRVVLVDSRAAELAQAPASAEHRLTAFPEAEIDQAPPGTAFVVTTHDHGLDFLLTLAALKRGDAAYVGLIGSATKRARFTRFARETDNFSDLSRLTCPIGAAGLGDKRPAVIALMTAQEIFAAFAHTAKGTP
ncbi:MAG: xanthine dehydrogenase accessory protein XdhC [Rhodobacteraceae bacterium]|nr:xanthine dehydrogenase accessory protein XdhC [Paracoccaceae bacterium]